jgi:hypothetical protein
MGAAGAAPRATGEWREERVTDIITRIRAEYMEMPGLCLTARQAQRLWGVDPLTCDAILAALTDAGYLRTTPRGYIRA